MAGSSTTRGRKTITAVAAAAALATLSAFISAASASDAVDAKKPAELASVSGSARVFCAYSPDDDIRFTVDVQAAPFSRPSSGMPQGMPTDARGTVKISHWVAAENTTVTSEADVDCLVTGDKAATFTAIVTKADPEVAEWIGQRLGFSVYDGGKTGHGGHGRDRLGFSWGVANADTNEKGEAIGGEWAPAWRRHRSPRS
ncbi:hypothetical protein [Streptomyces sp. NPDC054834]